MRISVRDTPVRCSQKEKILHRLWPRQSRSRLGPPAPLGYATSSFGRPFLVWSLWRLHWGLGIGMTWSQSFWPTPQFSTPARLISANPHSQFGWLLQSTSINGPHCPLAQACYKAPCFPWGHVRTTCSYTSCRLGPSGQAPKPGRVFGCVRGSWRQYVLSRYGRTWPNRWDQHAAGRRHNC